MPDLLDGPPKHLERYAPPWATDRRTICGRQLTDVHAWLTWDQGKKLIAKHGVSRAQLLLCQTCLSNQRRIKSPNAWTDNPIAIVNDYSSHTWPQSPGFDQTRAELLSLAQLVEAHKDEFRAAVIAHLTDELTARRKPHA